MNLGAEACPQKGIEGGEIATPGFIDIVMVCVVVVVDVEGWWVLVEARDCLRMRD